jgi:outer membrane protein assembly factor BamB
MRKICCIVLIIILLAPTFFTGVLADEGESSNTISSERCEKGYRYNTHGWIYLHIEGEPYERGYQHGYLLADEIIDMINRWINIFPQKWSWRIQKRDAMRLFWNKYPKEYKQEIQGIADGVAARGGKIGDSAIDYKDILTLNEMYESLTRFRRLSVYPFRLRDSWWVDQISKFIKSIGPASEELHTGKCSAFLATGDSTTDGGIVAAQSTFGGKYKEYWWHNYIAERWNVLLDIQPTKGHRMLMTTSPGLIWSDEDFYQNDAGLILMETTLHPGPWTRLGDPVVVRARKAIQYSDNIDEMVSYFLKKNNGLMANDWLMGDTKTREIASLELALRHHGLTRTKNGFIWSCNNPKNDKVRWELYSFSRFGLLGRILKRKFEPNGRDIKFEEILNWYHGKINVDVAKEIMSTFPICLAATDCKITSSQLIDNFGLWVFMGKPDGTDFIADDYPFKESKPSYTDLPACGWVQLFSQSKSEKYRSSNKKSDRGRRGKILSEFETTDGVFGNAVYSSPVVDKDVLYATSWNGNVYAIDINHNNLLWEKNIGRSSSSSPKVVGDRIYVGSSDGLFALNKESGEILWKNVIGTVSSKPAFFDGVVYCSSHDGNIYAFSSENGDLKWTFKTVGEVYSSPVINSKVLYVGSNDGYLYAVDIKDKDLKWKFETDGPVVSSPIVVNNVVYFGSWDGNLYSLATENGRLKWKFTTGWGIDSTPTFKDEIIFVGSEDNNFYAIDANNGKIKWTFTTNGGIQSSPTVYGGYVFFGSSDGKMYALDVSHGDLIWSIAPDYYINGIYNYKTKPIVSSPYVEDGKVFIGSTNGKIYCFDSQTDEQPEPAEKEIQIPIDTWLFLVIPLLFVIFATGVYLYFSRRKNS